MRTIELLAPAKNLKTGISAINAGADAVYIGANYFGAREAAANSLSDIETLTRYAHLFHSKVFVTLNTLLYEVELEKAVQLAHQVYEAGADALIIQDMGLLKADLPPVPLHASTQTDNRTPEKVEFLEKTGFDRVVLARELSLEQIKAIKNTSAVALEYFVHGSLCVSYSGQCYLSAAIGGRSANRGACAQPCRMTWNLQDEKGHNLIENKHLLSLRDLNRSQSLKDLIDAGIDSFKIEGRLKDSHYVSNVTAYYRQEIDRILEGRSEQKASSGKVILDFTPDPERSFNRGFTDYFVDGKRKSMANIYSPKSMGKKIGQLIKIAGNALILDTKETLNNGDGLCYMDEKNHLQGFRVNRVEGKRIYPAEKIDIKKGAILFRNLDTAFDKELENHPPIRKINLEISLQENHHNYQLLAKDEDGLETILPLEGPFEPATKPEQALSNLKKQLRKSGDTIYEIHTVNLELQTVPFAPAGKVNAWRRDLLEAHNRQRLDSHIRKTRKHKATSHPYPTKELDHHGNIANSKAEEFYREHGVSNPGKAFETLNNTKGLRVMTTKYCLKYELRLCPKESGHNASTKGIPKYIEQDGRRFRLKFNCRDCQMEIYEEE